MDLPIETPGQSIRPIPNKSGEYDILFHGQKAGHIQVRMNQNPMQLAYHGHIEYTISPRFRGHGLARKACESLQKHLLNQGAKSLWLTCEISNLPSIKTIEHLGAQLRGKITLPTGEIRYRYIWTL